MSKLIDAEYKLRRYKETVREMFTSSTRNAKRYGSQFVRSNKQEDRHAAMKFTAVAQEMQKLIAML